MITTRLSSNPASSQPEASESQRAAAREQNLVSTYIWAKERARNSKTQVYTYYWDHAPPGPKKEIYQAFHSADFPYMFNTLNLANRLWEPADFKIAETTSSYWANFVTKGDPNGKGLRKWPAFDRNSPITMELGDAFGTKPIAAPARVALFEEYPTKVQR